MPVSGLVVSLTDEPHLREAAIASIRQETRIEVGIIRSGRMAIVLDTVSTDEDKQLWHWLSSLPGVVFVDVAMVGFEEQGRPPAPLDRAASAMVSSPQHPRLKDKRADGR